jgi:Glycosyltransferase Family 4
MTRVGLVTALLPPVVGGTQVLVWRLFQDDPNLVVVSGENDSALAASQGYPALTAPQLRVPYPRLRGYRFGLAPALGLLSTAWMVQALVRVVRYLASQRVDQVVSIPHQGPFALLGLLAARRLGIPHTLYILDAWEEGATGPMEGALVRWGLRSAARMPRSRLAVVSPVLGAHYRQAFGFRDVTWIPNPAPLPQEQVKPQPPVQPFLLFTGGIKPFNVDALRAAVRSIGRCRVIQKFILTGHNSGYADTLQVSPELRDRVECRLCSPSETTELQAQAAVLLVANNVDDTSQTSLGYLPGRLPEYVSSGRPILLIGPQGSDAARAVRHWNLGPTTSSLDAGELAQILDGLAAPAVNPPPPLVAPHRRDLFLELFSRAEARRRLLGDESRPLSEAAAALAAAFERPSIA